MDGHNLHVTIELVHAMEVGLDVLTLPSHSSHKLQPLDVGVFAPYKKAFGKYRHAWVLRHTESLATKQILVMWISLDLQRALTKSNIEGGFCATDIWSFNSKALNTYLGPSRQFFSSNGDTCDS